MVKQGLAKTVSVTTAVNTAADNVSAEPNSEASEEETLIFSPLGQEEETLIYRGQVLFSLNDISLQNPTPDNRIQHNHSAFCKSVLLLKKKWPGITQLHRLPY